MKQTHRICDIFPSLKVGMQVETCADCYEVSSRPIKGVIGIIKDVVDPILKEMEKE